MTPSSGVQTSTSILPRCYTFPLSDLLNQDMLQNVLSGWCAHYGHFHAASQLDCGVILDYSTVYCLARLPIVLDNLFNARDMDTGTLVVHASSCWRTCSRHWRTLAHSSFSGH